MRRTSQKTVVLPVHLSEFNRVLIVVRVRRYYRRQPDFNIESRRSSDWVSWHWNKETKGRNKAVARETAIVFLFVFLFIPPPVFFFLPRRCVIFISFLFALGRQDVSTMCVYMCVLFRICWNVRKMWVERGVRGGARYFSIPVKIFLNSSIRNRRKLFYFIGGARFHTTCFSVPCG